MGKRKGKHKGRAIESAKEVQPLKPKDIISRRPPKELERLKKEHPGWRLIGVRASDWGLVETASPAKNICILPKTRGRRGKLASPGMRRQVIGVVNRMEVYKMPYNPAEKDVHPDEIKIDRYLVEEMRELLDKRVPELKATKLDKELKVRSPSGELVPLRIDVYQMVYPPKNLAEIEFSSKKELLETVRSIAEYVSLLAKHGIKYDDIKLENFAKNKAGLWVVDEEAEYLASPGRERVKDLRSIGRGLGRLIFQILDHPVHKKHRVTPEELRRVVEYGICEHKGSHVDKIIEGLHLQLNTRQSKPKRKREKSQ